jgi:N-acetylglucosaminyl-diphospho-decaprenol L-rhamnosyltransferase
MTSSSLGLVVVTYQSTGVLTVFLDSLKNSSIIPDSVVVVDNSPTALTLPKTPWLKKITLIHRPDNPGYGTAANHGIRSLDGQYDWVVVCNPDIVVQPETFSNLLVESNELPNAGALGPSIWNEDGSLYPSAREIPTLKVGIGHGLLGIVWPENPWTRAYRGDYRSPRTRQSGWLSGAFLLLKKSALDTVGGFDERYFMFFEDVDLGWRLGESGFTNYYVPSAKATHLGGQSTKHSHDAMLAAHHKSAVRFIKKLYPGLFWAPLRGLISLGLSLRERILRSKALVSN